MAEKQTKTEKDVAAKATKERVSKQTLKGRLKQSHSRSKRYDEAAQKIEAKAYPLPEAIDLAKATASTKFDSSIELHLHLTQKKGKKGVEDEYMRGILHLPHGMGKVSRVVILNEDMIEQLAKTQKIDFDVAIATPQLMPKLGKVAKILGTKGKMPNPKAGTVTDKPEEIKKEIEAGRVEYRQDTSRNIHQMVGKASWETEKLIENVQSVLKTFIPNRIEKATLTSTMGPSVKIEIVK